MAPLLLLIVIVGVSLAAFLFQGIAILFALQMPRLDPIARSPAMPRPKVSVLIAARNEEGEIAGCLDDLLAQRYPDLEILVVDGGSTDRTREIVRARAPRVRLIEEPPLPEGWVGKNWALDTGYRASTGEWLLFTDADMRYHPDAIGTTIDWAAREKAELVTLAPRIEAVGFWEKVILPFYAQMVLTYFRTPRVNKPDSRAAMANGQYTLVRREAYDRVGGHARIRSAVLEDVRLAREFRKAALPMRVAWAPELLSTRMYRDRREMFEGLLKNVHGTDFSASRLLGFLAGLVGFFWLPLAVLPIGLLWGIPLLSAWGALLYVVLFAKHYGLARGLRASGLYGLLFPIAVGFYVVLITTSLVRGIHRRPLVWKGRSYPIENR